jgi:5-methylcytosine-specific restriction endonuclease McrA
LSRPYGQRGKIKLKPHRTGPDGRPLCRWCDGPVPKGRRSWCSQKCVEEWRERGDWNHIRQRIIARDQVCQICGGCRYSAAGVVRAWILGHWNVDVNRSGIPENNALVTRVRREWEVDHIVAVEDGGTDDPANLRLLCKRCHKERTALQRRQKAIDRRRQGLLL